MKMKKNLRVFIFAFLICICFTIASQKVFAADGYQLLESMPGVGDAKSAAPQFPVYISKMYNFFVAFVIIAALLMVTIGGFSYILSAGNQAQAGTAKKIITDALIGLVVVFISWLVLNTINPDLLNTNPNMSSLQSGAKSTDKAGDDTTINNTSTVTHDGKNYATNEECKAQANISSDCTPLQNSYDNSQHYVQDPATGKWHEATDQECLNNPSNCKLGSNIIADDFNTPKTSGSVESDLRNGNIVRADHNNTNGDQPSVEGLPPVTVKAATDLMAETGCTTADTCPKIVGGTEKYGDGANRIDVDEKATLGGLGDSDFLNSVQDNAVETGTSTKKNGANTLNITTYVYPEGHALAGQRVDWVKETDASGSKVREYNTIYATKENPPAKPVTPEVPEYNYNEITLQIRKHIINV